MNSKPHIIYILSDEHRGQAMGHAGDPNLQTPNMDRMAAEGVSFRRAYANCPVCVPSRGTIFSGRHAHAGPVANFFDIYKPAAPSMATVLREQGYHTAYFGKWHCGGIRDQMTKEIRQNLQNYKGNALRVPENYRGGFQDWQAFECINEPFDTFVYHGSDDTPERVEGYQTDILTNRAMEYISNYKGDKPLFLVLSVEPPHFVCDAPERFKRFDPKELEVRPNFAKIPDRMKERLTDLGEPMLREILCNYYACVENLDWNIGRLLNHLEGTEDFEESISVYFSDHGDFVGSHGFSTTKIHEYEESVRIPAIFRAPGLIPAKGLTDGLFSLVDLMSTTLDLAGVPVPPWNQGASFAPLLRGESFDGGPEDVLLEMCGTPRWTPAFTDWRGLTTERWKYAFHEDGEETLFDLENDPYEMNNLADQLPEQCAKLKTLLLQRLRETREPYFDVIIEHGVEPLPHHYLKDSEASIQNARQKGGLHVGQ